LKDFHGRLKNAPPRAARLRRRPALPRSQRPTYETAIDQEEAAMGESRQREHPIAGAGNIGAECRGGGIDQRFVAVIELGIEDDATVFIAGRIRGLASPPERAIR